MDLRTATSRLRRTFAYPSDTTTTSPSSSRHLSDDEDDLGPALDEQEQEELIRGLAQQNAARNAQFRLFLLALPALLAPAYLYVLASGLARIADRGAGGRVADIWVALLALSSLASTAWTLWSLPPGVTGFHALDAWVGASASASTPTQGTGLMTGANAQRRRRRSSTGSRLFWAQLHRSPLEQYLPFLNVAICTLLVLAGLAASPRSAAAPIWAHVGLANLPVLIYVVVLVAKMLMGSVDPERELSALRYEYKGA
ncbi:hypothetical protein GGS24DRAFT_394989 [Hypoxylon argillaceum]|nr:hypothetical protein GGS24DRAFT_394989 [Hypoxylon argillaceum]KAI1151733.1 hypothetical protein F4825DRAFT_347305 [Nemania diffusa]